MNRLKTKSKCGQPSWVFGSSHVRAYLTRLGGHLGPVTFKLDVGGTRRRDSENYRQRHKSVQPFAVAPWAMAQENLADGTPGLLRSLRGDFFCCPFGANSESFRGERHPPHGETANGPWAFVGLDRTSHSGGSDKLHKAVTLHTRLLTTVRRGRVDKYLSLVPGHAAVYSRHVLTGMSGPMSLGHHALLQFPKTPGSGVVSTSRFVHAQVLPTPFERPEEGGYQSLLPGATFRKLERVPFACSGEGGGYADLTRFPARKGFDDLVMLTADAKLEFAWTAVTFSSEGYIWFALRDPRVLRHTILWMSNGGRHYPPWNGRHAAVMGVEDVMAYFHYGLAESARQNSLTRQGFPTALRLTARRPRSILYIMGVAAVPRGFERVVCIERADSGIDLIGTGRRRTHVGLDLSFLDSGAADRKDLVRRPRGSQRRITCPSPKPHNRL